MNILIKLTCLIGLVIAPILGDSHEITNEKDNTTIIEVVIENNNDISDDVIVEKNKNK